MPSHSRHLSLVVLLALLIVSLPAALPAHAQNMVVNSTADTDDGGSSCASGVCTLRKALRLANVNAGSSDMITFSVSGTINVTSALPTLADGGTTISGPSGHTLMLDGEFSATNASGLEIASANNTVRGLVISGFPGSNPFISGSGILIHGTTATGNTIANNWIGLSADGASAVGNQLYGVMLDDGAHGNLIGGSAAGEGNVIAGNWSANVAVYDTDGVTTGTDFIADNQIIGNNIGTNAAGTGVPTSTVQGNLEAGIRVGTFARNTLIKGNRIGGHIGNTSTAIGGAGILLQSSESVPDSLRHPQGTTIVGNDIGATPSGGAIDNTFGILFVGSAINTVIGDPTDLVGGRNVIGNSADSGIVLRDNSVNISGTQIVGNYIGLARNSTAMAPILAPIGSSSTAPDKAGIYLGTQNAGGPTTIGPGNVIAAVRRYGIRVRSDGNTVKGNLIGTDPAGTATSTTPFTSGTSFGLGTGGTGVWVENGSNNLIGGSSSADRNVIAIGGSGGGVAAAAIALRPNTSACSTCVVSNTTVQGNYLGVNVTGDAALANPVNSGTYGILISSTSGNTVRGNVISGAENGIILGNTASTNTIDANKIGTRASGSLAPADAIGNTQNGVYIVQGTGNQITNNLIAFNGVGSTAFTSYHGIDVASTTGGANNNTISGNRLVANGINPRGGPG
ncbi:MAG: NosD domain-containing protein, partial [Chloroflexales bacterium]